MPLERLYPKISYPVSRGTAMISPLIRWEHSQDWYVPHYDQSRTDITSERKLTVTLSEEEYKYMAGHVIDGKEQKKNTEKLGKNL